MPGAKTDDAGSAAAAGPNPAAVAAVSAGFEAYDPDEPWMDCPHGDDEPSQRLWWTRGWLHALSLDVPPAGPST